MTSPGAVRTFQMTGSSFSLTSWMMPKMPASTLTLRASPPKRRKYAMSSPMIVSPGIMAVEVLPHALGKAPVKYVTRFLTL